MSCGNNRKKDVVVLLGKYIIYMLCIRNMRALSTEGE
jgi:hypothetical protein